MTENNKEIAAIVLRERDSDGPPGLVKEMLLDLRNALPGLFQDFSTSGRTWLRGKSAQEAARAQQILSDVIDRIGRLNLDEREQRHRHAIESENHDIDVQRQRADMYLTSFERATKIVKDLNGAGIDIDVAAILHGLPFGINSIKNETAKSSHVASAKLENH